MNLHCHIQISVYELINLRVVIITKMLKIEVLIDSINTYGLEPINGFPHIKAHLKI